jgi:sporulation protein YlmC with PRC-barrel domain
MKTTALMRDVLDAQVMDRNGQPMGRVDGIVLELGDGPPRVTYLEISVREAWRRLGLRLKGDAYRVPWSRVIKLEKDVHIGVDADDTPPRALERWLRRKLR